MGAMLARRVFLGEIEASVCDTYRTECGHIEQRYETQKKEHCANHQADWGHASDAGDYVYEACLEWVRKNSGALRTRCASHSPLTLTQSAMMHPKELIVNE